MENNTTSFLNNCGGTVVTFYSFKGGVGRTMALANIAVLLAQANKRVLCIDWDMEAPGLVNYFRAIPKSNPKFAPLISEPAQLGGLLSILENSTPGKPADWHQYIRTRTGINDSKVDFIDSGDDALDFSVRLGNFIWKEFFENRGGAEIVEKLRSQWKRDYDYVLVDSRTGLTDSSGICTIQMPDILVLLFAANKQNTDWCARIAGGIRAGRSKLHYDREFLPIIPVLSRFDAREESDRAGAALDRIAEQFSSFFDWLPRSIKPRDMLNGSVLPYVPRYNFDEALAVEDEPDTGKQGLTFYYHLLSRLLLSRLQKGLRAILAEFAVAGATIRPFLPSASDLRDELRRDPTTIERYLAEIKSRVEEDPLEAAEAMESLANTCLENSRQKEAQKLLGEAIHLLGSRATAKSEEIPRLMVRQAQIQVKSGQADQSLVSFQNALIRAIEYFGEDDTRTADVHAAFARFLEDQKYYAEATEQYSLAVKAYERSSMANKHALLDALKDWRELLVTEEKYQELLPVAKRALELELQQENSNPALKAWAEDIYATALKYTGNMSEAVEHYREALSLEEKAAYTSEDSLGISRALKHLAEALNEIKCFDEAELLLLQALTIDTTVGGQYAAPALAELAAVLHKAGRSDNAEPFIRQYEEVLGQDRPDSARDYHERAKVSIAKGQLTNAEQLLRLALSRFEKDLGEQHQVVGNVCYDLGSVLFNLRSYDEAEYFLRRAMDINEKKMGPQNPKLAEIISTLASVYKEMNRHLEAEQLLLRSKGINEKVFGPDHYNVGVDLVLLAQTLANRVEGKVHADEILDKGVDLIQNYLRKIQDRQRDLRKLSFVENDVITFLSKESPLEITSVSNGGTTLLLKIREVRLDAHKSDQLKYDLQKLLEGEGKSLILDLSELTFLDSSGLGALLVGYKKAISKQGRLVLVGVQERVQHILKMTRLDKIFEIYPNVDAALAQGLPQTQSHKSKLE